jgi:polar amino acid transport system substrate-binding protein
MRSALIRLAAGAGVLLTVAAALSGCTGHSTRAAVAATPRLRTVTPSVSPTAAPASCGDPTASLRPPSALPKPGAMPAGSFMAKIAARGYLVVGTSADTLLFSSRDPFTGSIVGFDIDTAGLIAQAIFGDSSKIQIVVIPNSARIAETQSGAVDLVAETMTVNCARIKQVDFSTVYFEAGQRILVANNSKVKSIADLGGKRVCAASGSTSLDAIKAARSRPIPVVARGWGDCLVDFQQNEVDAISTDDTILAGLAAQDPYAQVRGPRFTAEPYGLAISKSHPEFTRFVNGVLARARADGTWNRLDDRWLSKYGLASKPPEPHYRD